MNGALGRIFRGLLRSRNLELKEIGAPPRGYSDFITALHEWGFAPGTVIDVGVADGTPWLHGEFPDAKLVLVEPNDQFADRLEELRRQFDADVHTFAAGPEAGRIELIVDVRVPSSSSAFSVSSDYGAYRSRIGDLRKFEPKSVEMRPLDSLPLDDYAAPYLLKVDTEGFELEALRGAEHLLERTGVLLLECSVASRFEGSYTFAELIAFLAARNFRLFDVARMVTRGKRGPLSYMDAAFVPSDSPLIRTATVAGGS